MAYIIYISPEEEVTSLISRLRRHPKNDLILVIPQRAFILESLINLQLLKKELDSIEKRFVIVTQDDRGSSSAKRAGIEVHPKTYIETIQENQDRPILEQEEYEEEKENAYLDINYKEKEEEISQKKDEKNVFYPKQREESIYTIQPTTRSLHSMRGVSRSITTDGIRSKSNSGIIKNEGNGREKIHKGENEMRDKKRNEREVEGKNVYDEYTQRALLQNKKGIIKDIPSSQPIAYEEVSNAFPYEERGELQKKTFSFPVRTIFFTILIFGGFAFSSFLLLKYIPKANVKVVMEKVEIADDIEITASSEEGESLPLKIFTESITFTETFPSTGRESSDTRRATGTVTLYNTFSQEPQPLVATTRLLSEDGKVFRLTKSVVVPGKKNENGTDVPGKIQVEVKADEPGETYNIQASRFSIPGFEGSPKYEAFYAESQEAFIGGGGNISEMAVVTEKDIENARKKIEEIAREKAKEKISSVLSDDWILIEDAWDIALENADAFPGIGSMAEKFEYSVVVKVQVMSWQKSVLEEAVKKKLFMQLSETGKEFKSNQWLLENIDIQYGKATPDFEKESLQLKTFSSLKGRFILEEENFKKDILGKTTSEINLISEKYEGIREISIERKPSDPLWLFSRVSSLDSRVVLEVE
ncbi:MAG: hypothetical protein EOM19_01385 [Candidatus Moranbacteria bacterium]|nr:hypothetical protein [Candidatus Moranbacteria bacterium]